MMKPDWLRDVLQTVSSSVQINSIEVTMKHSLKFAGLALIVLLAGVSAPAQRKSGGGSGLQSHARAREVLEAGINALGGLDAIREAQDVKVKISGFSYARNQSLGVNPPYDKMTR